jgi:hypothetical protein
MAFAANLGSTYQYGNNIILYNANATVNPSFFFTFSPQSANGLTLSNGTIWTSNVHNGLRSYQAGLSEVLSGCFFCATGNVVANVSAGETSLIPTGLGTTTIPANFMTAGKTIRLSLAGVISSNTPNGGNISVAMYLGGTKLVNNSTNGLEIVAGLNGAPFTITGYYTCITPGNSTVGVVRSNASIVYDNDSSFGLPINNGLNVDTTVNNVINVTATVVGGSGVGANITVYQTLLEVIY